MTQLLHTAWANRIIPDGRKALDIARVHERLNDVIRKSGGVPWEPKDEDFRPHGH